MKLSIGLKSKNIFPALLDKALCSRLKTTFEYFEYQAPLLNFHSTLRSSSLHKHSLRPHGVRLSLAHTKPPPDSILKRLKAECRATRTPYLAEHIGQLSLFEGNPSIGYLFPPALNEKTIENIARNVAIVEDACEVPLALENPVIYARDPSSTFDWDQMLVKLHQLLPTTTGWLIDLAHLKVTCASLHSLHPRKSLDSYALTGRRIFEVHSSATRLDSYGVLHDDHRSMPTSQLLNSDYALLCAAGLNAESLTIEFDNIAEENISALELAIDNFRSGESSLNEAKPEQMDLKVPVAIRRNQENAGRMSILRDRILDQFWNISPRRFQNRAITLGYQSLDSLVADFYKNLATRELTSIGYYEVDEFDAVDLRWALYLFIREKEEQFSFEMLNRRFVHELFKHAIFAQFAFRSIASNGRPQPHLVKLRSAKHRLPVFAKIISDRDENIEMQKISKSEFERLARQSGSIIFDEKKGEYVCVKLAQKRKKRSQQKKRNSKSAISLNTVTQDTDSRSKDSRVELR